ARCAARLPSLDPGSTSPPDKCATCRPMMQLLRRLLQLVFVAGEQEKLAGACQCHFFGDCGTHAARCAGNKDRFAFDFHESSPRVISVAAKWLMSALGLGCAKTPALALHVETSRSNCISESQIILHTPGSMPCWRIVFSTFRGCMSFYSARVKFGHSAMSARCPVCQKADIAGRDIWVHALL